MILEKEHKKKFFLGIDLGTTYSLAATIKKGKVLLLLDDQNRYLLPSVVHYKKDAVIVGWSALEKLTKDPVNTITSVKRLLGRSIDFIKRKYPILPYTIEKETNGNIFFHTNFGLVTPVDVSSEILQHLKKRANIFFNKEIYASIITVPAYFNNIQRKLTKKAAILAKINLIRLLNEPTAASIAYGLQIKKKGIIVVYDLGGGTFDISILKLNKGIFEVLATSGDSNLGGDDFDFALASYIYNQLKLSNKCNDFFHSLLMKVARETKLKLTKHDKVKVHFFNWKGYITRHQFNLLIVNFVKKTLLICSNLLNEINLPIEKIEEIIMVGGSTRVPLVYQQVARFFKKTPLNSIDPDQVVAIGAAMQTNMLIGNEIKNKTLLLDVIPLSLGIEVMGGFFEKIILRNTTIPISKTKEFTTYKDNQTSILIHVLQGEGELVENCISLYRFVLKDIKPQKAGLTRILVTFEVDADGLINLKILERSSNKEQLIKIDNNVFSNHINASEIIENSFKNSKKDYCLRVKREKQIECKRVLEILDAALQDNEKIISAQELQKIKYIAKKLKKSIYEDDFFSMKLNLKNLEEVSKNFFSLQLQNTVCLSSIEDILKEKKT